MRGCSKKAQRNMRPMIAAMIVQWVLAVSLAGCLALFKVGAPLSEIPNIPFAGAPKVRVDSAVSIAPAFRLLGPWAPLWLGPNMVALAGTIGGQLSLVAWYGEHFNTSRILADSSAVQGATILDMAVSRDGKRVAIAAATGTSNHRSLRAFSVKKL